MKALILSSAEGRHFDSIIRQAMDSAGIETIRLDESILPGARWASAIEDAIHAADLVVVDISDANPNIMFELGFASAVRKPTVILARRDSQSTKIPSNLAGMQFLLYDPEDPSGLANSLRKLTIQTPSWAPSKGE